MSYENTANKTVKQEDNTCWSWKAKQVIDAVFLWVVI